MSKKTVNVDELRNKWEKHIYKQLRAIQRGTEIDSIEYETHELSYVIRRTYVPDFIIQLDSGRKIFLEAKGYLRPDDQAKLLAVRDDHQELDIRLVFMQNNKLNRNAKMRYSDWCEKHGFQYAIGDVPKEWFK